MIDIYKTDKRSSMMIKAIIKNAHYDRADAPTFAYWPLCIDDKRQLPKEVDTCATSYCVSILEAEKRRIENDPNNKKDFTPIIIQAIRTLIAIRRNSGEWPSVVEPKKIGISLKKKNGEVAIGDNYYAIKALLDAGFLSDSFEYAESTPQPLSSLENRIAFLEKTIDWLANNRAAVDKTGWYYTNSRDLANGSATLPTCNIIILLNTIRKCLSIGKTNSSLYKKVCNMIASASDSLLINIHADGGIGKTIISQYDQQSSVIHTCKMVEALLTCEKPEYIHDIEKAVAYVLATCQSMDKLEFTDDLYCESYSLKLAGGEEVSIQHENYVEGILLNTFMQLLLGQRQSTSFLSQIKINTVEASSLVDRLMANLTELQSKGGPNNGLFKAHISRPEGKYPVYASFEGYRAINLYKKYATTESTMITDEGEDKMISILHLSDFHFSRDAAMHNMRQVILNEVRAKVHNKPRGEKLLVITGDFHNFWAPDYNDAIIFLRDLVSAMDIDLREDVFIIPGNHDVADDKILEPIISSTIPDWKKHKNAAIKMIAGGDYSFVDWRMEMFIPYCMFARAAGIYPIASDPIKETGPATVHIRRWREKLNILHLNTALVADGKTKDNQLTDIVTATDPKLWESWYRDDLPAIALGHNSFYDLKKEQRTALKTMFAQRNVSAYLCGDTHLTELDDEKQTISLEAGAVANRKSIPNIVCAKSVADMSDTYSDFGYYWHEWNEATGVVQVTFHEWQPSTLARTSVSGIPGEYIMRANKNIGKLSSVKENASSFSNSDNNTVVHLFNGPIYYHSVDNRGGIQAINFGTGGSATVNVTKAEQKAELTWARFVVNHPNTSTEFEHLCTDLFKREYFSKDTVFASIPNNPGLEFHSKTAIHGDLKGKRIGFQSKFFMGAVSYSNIKDSVVTTIRSYHEGREKKDQLEVYVLYCNQPISQSDESGILKGNKIFIETKHLLERAGISIVVCAGNDLLDHIQKYPDLVNKYFFV